MIHVVLYKKNPALSARHAPRWGRGRATAALLARLAAPALLAAPLLGCGILPDTSNPPAECELPAPEGGWLRPTPQPTPVQQKKRGEVCQRVKQNWTAQGYVRVMTMQMSQSGDVIDCFEETSVAGSDAEPPPPPLPSMLVLPQDVQWQRMEPEDPAEARRPDNTIPILRPDYAEYVYKDTGATSLDDWIQHYQRIGDPSGGGGRLYAGVSSEVANQGAAVNINSFGGPIQLFTMSVHEMVVGCPKGAGPGSEMWQWVGIASMRDFTESCGKDKADAGKCGDQTTLRLRAEFLTAGPTLLGNEKGGWNNFATGFIPVRGIRYPLGASFDPRTISTVGGTQYESLYQIEIKNGDWWVGHNGNWLGYFPASLFDNAPPVNAGSPSNLIATQACKAQYYGEVSADLKKLSDISETWTWTPLGSGRFAEEGWSKASYLRNPIYRAADASGTWALAPTDPNITKDVTPYNPACYTKTPLQTGASPWDLFFYSSGPGANFNPLCQ